MFGGCSCLRSADEDVCELDFCHQSLCDVPADVFVHERTLERLDLGFNQICDLPVPLFHCHSLRELRVNDNELHALPPAIASLIQLLLLDASKNAIASIPDNINGCKLLSSVDLSVNPLVRLPDGFTQLLALQELYLNDTFLEYLPGNFGRLSRLRVLELRDNRLTGLPKSMCRLTQLQRLDIGQNELSDLPSVVSSLSSLTELLCDNNRLSSIPASFGQLTSLNHLDLSNNSLTHLPDELARCQALVYLELSANLLQCLPECCGSMTSLVTLKAFDNTLTSLPRRLDGLSQLQELDVSHNVLTQLPASVGLLRQLCVLNCNDNSLTSLPSELGSCRCLRVLCVSNNLLRCVPAELGYLNQLHVLNLCNNRLQHLPCSFSKLHSLRALWLSDNQSKPLVPLQSERSAGSHKVLSCYMLPQLPASNNEQNGTSKRSLTRRHANVSNGGVSNTPARASRITFSGLVACGGAEGTGLPPGRLTRAPTPYPKELRALAKRTRHLLQLDAARHNKVADDGEAIVATSGGSCNNNITAVSGSVGDAGGDVADVGGGCDTSAHPSSPPSAGQPAVTLNTLTLSNNNNKHYSLTANQTVATSHVTVPMANQRPASLAPSMEFSNRMSSFRGAAALATVGQRPAAPPPYHLAAVGRNMTIMPAGGSFSVRTPRSCINQQQQQRQGQCVGSESYSRASNGITTHHPATTAAVVCSARSSLPPDLRSKHALAAWKQMDVCITKCPGLGFSIAGGKSPKMPVYVSRVQSGGPACAVLHVGDRLVSVDGRQLSGDSCHDDAVSLLLACGDTVRLSLLRRCSSQQTQ